ncbi:hypothetical protein [Planobispora takensis]|uniref:hypothetical protein n=1 Tax=Planobispora takensis TaxID=1367882 RepID=UPI0019450EEE|nr:hypothetical protein [Planobispora takensis]
MRTGPGKNAALHKRLIAAAAQPGTTLQLTDLKTPTDPGAAPPAGAPDHPALSPMRIKETAMEAGKWIIFAALAGAVFVGFKSRQLKMYEFFVCGLFVLLLDGLVFNGQISKWVGDLGSNIPDVADSVTAGLALGPASPRTRRRLAAFGRALWAQRPHWSDYLIITAITLTVHYLLGWSWWFGAVAAGALAVLVAINAALTVLVGPPAGNDGHRGDPDGRHG